MGRAGIEPATPGFSVLCRDDGNPNLSKDLRQIELDPAALRQRADPAGLSEVVDAWPGLPDNVRSSIVAMVRSATTAEPKRGNSTRAKRKP